MDLPTGEDLREDSYYPIPNVQAHMTVIKLCNQARYIFAARKAESHPLPGRRLSTEDSKLAHLAASGAALSGKPARYASLLLVTRKV
jgi:hypothetical protein